MVPLTPNQGGWMNSRAPPPELDDPKKPAKEEAKPSTSAAGKDRSKTVTADDEIYGHPV